MLLNFSSNELNVLLDITIDISQRFYVTDMVNDMMIYNSKKMHTLLTELKQFLFLI